MCTLRPLCPSPIVVLFALLAVSCGPLPGVAGGQPNATSRPADLFSFTSDYNDYIGLGRSQSFTPPTARFAVTSLTQRDSVHIMVERAGDYWSIDLAAPTGHDLAVGTYEHAADPAGRTDKTALLMVYGEGRACTPSAGSFTIKQITFDEQGRLLALRATFVQRCELPDAGPLRGTLDYGRPAN